MTGDKGQVTGDKRGRGQKQQQNSEGRIQKTGEKYRDKGQNGGRGQNFPIFARMNSSWLVAKNYPILYTPPVPTKHSGVSRWKTSASLVEIEGTTSKGARPSSKFGAPTNQPQLPPNEIPEGLILE